MFALWHEHGVVERGTRLRLTAELLGRHVESSAALSKRDANKVIELLQYGDLAIGDTADDDDFDPADLF